MTGRLDSGAYFMLFFCPQLFPPPPFSFLQRQGLHRRDNLLWKSLKMSKKFTLFLKQMESLEITSWRRNLKKVKKPHLQGVFFFWKYLTVVHVYFHFPLKNKINTVISILLSFLAHRLSTDKVASRYTLPRYSIWNITCTTRQDN